MNHCTHPKAAIAAACLAFTACLAGAQSTPPSNTTTSPDPLQVNPPDGVPNAGNGKLTPGTGTGSSRTMRNETMRNDSTPVDPANTNRGAGSPDPQMAHPAITPGKSSTTDSNANKPAIKNSSESLDPMEPTGAGTNPRAARRDRG